MKCTARQGCQNGVHEETTTFPVFEREAQASLHNSIISSFVIYQDQLETNLL